MASCTAACTSATSSAFAAPPRAMQPRASVFHSVTTLALAGATQPAANRQTRPATAVRASGRAEAATASGPLLFTWYLLAGIDDDGHGPNADPSSHEGSLRETREKHENGDSASHT